MTIGRGELVVLIGIVAVAAMLRSWQVGESLWVDELHTAWTVQGSLADVVGRAADGNQSPLYGWMVWLSVRAWGASELAVRLPSLIAGVLLVVAVYWLCRRWTASAICGWLAAALVALDPICLFYSIEARPYACVQLLGVLQVAIYVDLLCHPTRRNRSLFVLASAGLFYLHYTTLLLPVGQLLLAASSRWLVPKRVAWPVSQIVMDGGLLLACLLPALGHLWTIQLRRDAWEPFAQWKPAPAMLRVASWDIGLPAVLALIPLVVAWRKRRPWSSPIDALIWASLLVWLGFPALCTWFLTVSDWAALFMLRYVIVSFPAAMVFAALAVRCWPHPAWRAGVAVLLCAVAVVTSGYVDQWRKDCRLITDHHEDWRSATAWFNQVADDQHPRLLIAALVEDAELRGQADPRLRRYCLFPLHSLYAVRGAQRWAEPLPTWNPPHLDPQQRQQVREAGAAWIIVRAGPITTRRVVQCIQAELGGVWQVGPTRRFGNLAILLLRK